MNMFSAVTCSNQQLAGARPKPACKARTRLQGHEQSSSRQWTYKQPTNQVIQVWPAQPTTEQAVQAIASYLVCLGYGLSGCDLQPAFAAAPAAT